MSPGNMYPGRATCTGYMYVANVECRRTHVDGVARPGYMLTVSRRHNYYSFMSRSTCIALYPATDGQQTGDNFVADTRCMYRRRQLDTSGYNTYTRQHVS